jgi:hypothetical protein
MAPFSVSNGQFLLAQIGSRSKKQRSLSVLIGVSELPGPGWVQRDERVFRLGKLGERTPWGERAGREGNFAATRSFEQALTGSWIVSEVLPLVSVEDASAAVSNWSTDKMWRNSKFHGELVDEQEVAKLSVAQVDAVRIVLQETMTSNQRSYVLNAFGSVGTTAFFVGVSQPDVPLSVDRVSPIIAAQAAKLSPLPHAT